MTKNNNADTARQVKILKEFVLVTCQDKEDQQAIQKLIIHLEQQDSGMILKRDLAIRWGITLITLNKRIESIDGLRNELFEKFGYAKWRKHLMPGEVKMIEEYFSNSPTKP